MLTIAEHYHLHGTLLPGQIEELLDMQLRCEKLVEAGPYISEIYAGLPEEDCLGNVLYFANKLLNSAQRSKYKDGIATLKKQIEREQSALWRSAEHGEEHLAKLEKLIGELTA